MIYGKHLKATLNQLLKNFNRVEAQSVKNIVAVVVYKKILIRFVQMLLKKLKWILIGIHNSSGLVKPQYLQPDLALKAF